MTNTADERYTVALLGFSEFERITLSSLFRLATRRGTLYVQADDPALCDFLIVDAEHAAALRAARTAERAADTVFVGHDASVRDGGLWLKRPIEPTQLLRALDTLVERRADRTVALLDLASVERAPADPDAATRAPAGLRAQMQAPLTPFPTLPDPDTFAAIEAPGPDVLIAEDSRIARRFLQMRLTKLGYNVHMASDGDEVLEQITLRSFRIIFLDVTLGDAQALDGFALCQHLKQHPDLTGANAPRIAFVTGLSGPTDRVRGNLAGCDAYLTKPVHEADLLRALHDLDPDLAKRLKAREQAAALVN